MRDSTLSYVMKSNLEAATRGVLYKKLLLKFLQYSQEKACVEA